MLVSVDEPQQTQPWAESKGFTFDFASDPALEIIGAWDLVNEDEGIAWHAVFIVDTDGVIFYRKVGRRRPKSIELLDAIDYHYALGEWAQ